MSYNGSGTFNINSTGQPVVTGTVISSTVFNALTSDLATGLTTAITKDGQTTTTARIPFAQGVNSTLTTDATSSTTGSIITAGGISTQKALWVGTTSRLVGLVTADAGVSSTLTTDATSSTTGSIVTAGGISSQKAAFIGTTLNFGGYAAEGTVASAATTDLSTSTANRQTISGTTTITSFGTGANLYRIVRFTGTSLVLTHNATTLILPTGANIQTAAGDVATFQSDGSGNWRCLSYQPYGGVVDSFASAVSMSIAAANITSLSIPAGKWRVSATGFYNSSNANGAIRISISATSNTMISNYGKDTMDGAVSAEPQGAACIPAFDVTLTTATTYYLVGAVYSSNSANCNGYIRAERIF